MNQTPHHAVAVLFMAAIGIAPLLVAAAALPRAQLHVARAGRILEQDAPISIDLPVTREIQVPETVIRAEPGVQKEWHCEEREVLHGYRARGQAPMKVRACSWE